MSSTEHTKRVAGAPAPEAVDAIRAEAMATKGTGNEVYVGSDISRSNAFPIVPFDYDTYDTTAALKEARAGNQAQWVVPFTKEDAQYELRKRDAMEKADFDDWIMQKFDLSDPAQNRMLQEIAPEQFLRREELIRYKQMLITRMAALRLYGPRSEADLKFEWLVETGRIKMPEEVIWKGRDGSGKTDEQLRASNMEAYRAGRYNPLTYFTGEGAGKAANTKNYSDIWTNSLMNAIGQPSGEYFDRGVGMLAGGRFVGGRINARNLNGVNNYENIEQEIPVNPPPVVQQQG